VQREILNRYEDSLSELQNTFQKAADLEGALAVRTERQRVAKDGSLTEKVIVPEPKSLRTLQLQNLAKIQELVAQVVQETLPRLVEHKKSLTQAGKLDEAVAIRDAIERLQNNHVPIAPPDPAVAVSADTLLLAYAADRARADKTYRGQKFTVRGILGGYRQDPADPKQYQVYVSGSAANGGWVLCAFTLGDYRFREDKAFSGSVLVVMPKDSDNAIVRWQKGQQIDIRGTCEGFDEAVRLTRCELPR
jgi:hypothetical protein